MPPGNRATISLTVSSSASFSFTSANVVRNRARGTTAPLNGLAGEQWSHERRRPRKAGVLGQSPAEVLAKPAALGVCERAPTRPHSGSNAVGESDVIGRTHRKRSPRSALPTSQASTAALRPTAATGMLAPLKPHSHRAVAKARPDAPRGGNAPSARRGDRSIARSVDGGILAAARAQALVEMLDAVGRHDQVVTRSG
jgi:hypothetical protein